MEVTDQELLRRFATKRCEEAFRHLVDRHVRMVFSVAHRVTGDQPLSEEITQTTFVTLAEKAGQVGANNTPAGWLYHTARHLALRTIRSEQRRREREQVAVTMNTDEPDPGVVAEHLESAMDQLKPEDRDALVLRFFEERNLRDVGLELGLSEDAARMRVNRALEKLRSIFGRLGITGSTLWLAATLPTSAAATVPAGLSSTISTAVLSGTALAATAANAATLVTQTTTSTMTSLFNLKTAAAVLTAAALTGTSTYLVKEREADQLRTGQSAMASFQAQLAAERLQALTDIQSRDQQIALLQKEVVDLPRLRGEVDRLNRGLADMESLKARNQQLQQMLAASREQAAQPAIQPVVNKSDNDNALIYDEVFLVRYGLWTKEKENEVGIQRLNQFRKIGLALINYADAYNGRFPRVLSEAAGYFEGELQSENVELLFTGSVREITNPAQTIIARQKNLSKAADGDGFWRTYVFADGHSEIKRGANIEELTAWESARTMPSR